MRKSKLKIRPLHPGEENRIYKFIKPIFNNHISIFFVKSTEQEKGIGKQLLRKCVRLCKRNNTELKKITVHSSPNAVEIYKKLGFKVIGKGQVKEINGIRFVSMKLGV